MIAPDPGPRDTGWQLLNASGRSALGGTIRFAARLGNWRPRAHAPNASRNEMAVFVEWDAYLRSCNAADGFVYVLTNESLPTVVKVGYTDRRPDVRAAELHSTGVPTPFKVSFCFQCGDPRAAERRVHAALAAYRVRSDREFFQCSAIDAAAHILQSFEPSHYYDGASLTMAARDHLLKAKEAAELESLLATKECPTCRGRGEVRVSQGYFSIQKACPNCSGRGKVRP